MSEEMVGVKVTLQKDSRWAAGREDPSNPLGVVGVITSYYDEDDDDDGSYGVSWSNGYENNGYRIPDDLKVIGVLIES